MAVEWATKRIGDMVMNGRENEKGRERSKRAESG
jgi:hypothetical protein